MLLKDYLQKNNYVTTETEIANILRYCGEKANIEVAVVYAEKDLTILKWEDKGNELWGFLRDDNSGWSGIVVFDTLDDQETLAAWNADFDIEKLKNDDDGIDWNCILAIAAENQWGFDAKGKSAYK